MGVGAARATWKTPTPLCYTWRVPDLTQLLEKNKTWAAGAVARDADYFGRLVGQQTPNYLWIGCADSRVPANQIVGLEPGELFVHRNVANVVVHSDLNCLSVLQYAVDVLGVTDVIVCGHYGCGGVQAVLKGLRVGLVDNWLQHVRDVLYKHQAEIDALDESERLNRLCELNVVEQTVHVAQTTVIRDAWARGQTVSVHGWVYSLTDGVIRDLGVTCDGP